MKIGIVTASLKGGAGIAALRLHESFRSCGTESILINQIYHEPQKEIYSSDKLLYTDSYSRLLRWIRRKTIFRKFILPFVNTDVSFSLFSVPFSENQLHKIHILQTCDVINLHWTSGYVDLPTFLSNINIPVFFTLHDTNYFTAGCHYFKTCDGFKNNCISCPIIDPQVQEKLNAISNLKKVLFDKKKHFVIGISNWIAQAARESTIMSKLTTTSISNSFVPLMPHKGSRISADNNSEKIKALIIAQHLNDERKGWRFIEELIEKNNFPNLLWVVVGKGDIKQIGNALYLGEVHSPLELASIYSEVDIMVHPALQDNFPNTIVESLCYGTPVVAFETSGMVDLINSRNGVLAKKIDSNSLSIAIESLLNNLKDYDRISIREEAVLKFSPNIQSSNYINFFKNCLENG